MRACAPALDGGGMARCDLLLRWALAWSESGEAGGNGEVGGGRGRRGWVG